MLGTGVSPSGPAFVSRQGSARVLLVALLLAPLVPCVASAGDPVVPVPAPPADARSEADTLRAAADALRPSLVHLTWVPAARPEAGERRVGLVLGPGGHIVAAGPTAFEPGRWIARRDDGHSAEARVLGRDPETRALRRQLERIADIGVLISIGRLVHTTDSPLGLPPEPAVADYFRRRLAPNLDYLESVLADGRPLLAGDEVTIGDCTLAAALQFGRFRKLEFLADHPNLRRWDEAYRGRETAQGILVL